MVEKLAVPVGHSPLGASGAERWMKCPGSVTLAHGVNDEEDDTYSAPGRAAHALAAKHLVMQDDAWESIGTRIVVPKTGSEVFYPPKTWTKKVEKMLAEETVVPVDKEMADAVQVYLDHARYKYPECNQGNWWVERRFHCPTLHKYFYGTSDQTWLNLDARHLYVDDFKYGAGIVVDAKDNPQLKYYAAGMLETLGLWLKVDTVTLTIVQPRGFHFDGPIRSWSISTDDLWAWVDDTLLPAMEHALVSRETKSGEHCRFCPVRYRNCPQMEVDMNEMEVLMSLPEFSDADTAAKLSGPQVARFLDLFEVAKIRQKAALKTAFGRLQVDSQSVPGYKLVAQKTNRDWKPEAEPAIVEHFGEAAYNPKALMSPAQLEKLPEGEKFTARYAFKPAGGLTVAKGEDTRAAVNRDVKAMFSPVKKGKK